MKKLIVILVTVLLFTSCGKQKITYKGNEYILVDLNNGIFVDKYNQKHKLYWNINGLYLAKEVKVPKDDSVDWSKVVLDE